MQTILTTVIKSKIAQITLNRPQAHNALNKELIQALTTQLDTIANDPNITAVIIIGSGASFCAGADLHWLLQAQTQTEQENIQDAMQLAELLLTLYTFPKLTLAAIQGSAYGGGIGLLACCDIAIAANQTQFCFSEVKLGLAPVIISPYVIAAIGKRAAQNYFLSGERFDALKALQLGLISQISEPEALLVKVFEIAQRLVDSNPEALSIIKRSTHNVIGEIQIKQTIDDFVRLRNSPFVQSRLQSFLAKNKL